MLAPMGPPDTVEPGVLPGYILPTPAQWLRRQTWGPASLGSTPAGTRTSHWWWQEEHPVKIAEVRQ